MELLCLHKRVLALAGIEHEHDLLRRTFVAPPDDSLDLGQFVHQSLLVLQASGRIRKQYIDVACSSRVPGVENDCRGVGTTLLRDDRNIVTLAPGLQLLYGRGADYARTKGVILADTKFEFGMHNGELTLIDEALTPDSSRYWEASAWEPGHPQPSFDKQPVRDWLDGLDWDKKPPAPPMPQSAIDETRSRYREIYRRLTGKELS